MNKILTYFLTFSILLSNTIGGILIYNQIKFYHKKSIKSAIKNNSFFEVVEVLAFSKERLKHGDYDLKFIEEHEFRFQGKMYDIISSWETKDSIFYKCINDKREEELEGAFLTYIVNNNHRQDIPLPIKQSLNLL
ncbi:MAG: hypothetical protein N3F03_03185, partial [Ignavibacteria bacterium]|nr:hypothetical protein [Ignavibacteria bacterium]